MPQERALVEHVHALEGVLEIPPLQGPQEVADVVQEDPARKASATVGRYEPQQILRRPFTRSKSWSKETISRTPRRPMTARVTQSATESRPS